MRVHPLRALLDNAAAGTFPPADGVVEVVPSPGGLADAIIGLTGHFMLAADIDAAELAPFVPPGDFSAPMSSTTLNWLAQRLGSKPATFDALVCHIGTGEGAPDWLHEVDGVAHLCVERVSCYRTDMRVFVADDDAAVLAVGRGVCDRWEFGFEVSPGAEGRGLGRKVARAATSLVPAGEPLWGQVAPGNAASLRAVGAAGFVPVGAEVLFPRARNFGRVEGPAMADEMVLTEPQGDGVVVVRLNMPPMNPLSRALLEQLRDVARSIGADASVKAVVVAGSEKAFAAGADISEFGDQDKARVIERAFRDAFDAIAAIPRPVIAAIRGYALGGGLELACACDLRVAGETARLGQPEILLGIIPGAGGTQRLTRLVGPARAKEMIWSGRQVRAEEALSIGLVDRVAAPDEVEHTALHWAGELGKGAVVAMGLAKRAIDRGLDGSLADGLDLECEAFIEVFGTEDASTGVKSFLADGPGKAKFAGR